jgi:DNA gyrase/topoisomerase IV subunit B
MPFLPLLTLVRVVLITRGNISNVQVDDENMQYEMKEVQQISQACPATGDLKQHTHTELRYTHIYQLYSY